MSNLFSFSPFFEPKYPLFLLSFEDEPWIDSAMYVLCHLPRLVVSLVVAILCCAQDE
jgi:hypothetical protein